VNTQVDRGIAPLVSLLSSIPGVQTLQSCQGFDDSPAYVYFWYRDWKSTCDLVFGRILPCLESAGCSPTVSVEVFNGSQPTAKLSLAAEALAKATSALSKLLHQ
jgi:hypothetical protein